MRALMKTLITMILVGTILINPVKTQGAAGTSWQKLEELGLLTNTSASELNATLNRMVGLTMVLKTLGYTDEDAGKMSQDTVFQDLKKGNYQWGIGWINIGLKESIATGTSGSTFSPGRDLTKREFLTYILRLLGYDSQEAWKNCGRLSVDAGLIDAVGHINQAIRFTKSQAADILYRALDAEVQNGNGLTLAEHLIAEGVIKEETAIKLKMRGLDRIRVAELQALSGNRIILELKEPVFTVSVDDFYLTNQSGRKQDIKNVKLSDDGKTITLETKNRMYSQSYHLTVGENEISFDAGSFDTYKPRLNSATAIHSTRIKLVFSEEMDESVLAPRNYRIKGLTVSKAEFDKDIEGENIETTVYLTTSKQSSSTKYRIDVSDVYDLAGNEINTSQDSASFYGKKEDNKRPRISSVRSISTTKVRVLFNEDMDENTLRELENYDMDRLTLFAVEIEDKDTVYLTTSEQQRNHYYTLTINNVRDLAENIIDSSYNSKTFYNGSIDEEPPELEDIDIISNTRIRLVFSEAVTMESASMPYAYYLGEELLYPIEVKLDSDEDDRTTWILITRRREDIEYNLTIRGVQDDAGNLIEEKTITIPGS